MVPAGVMFSIAKSRYTFSSQAIFFILNALGLFLGTVYNANTPDLYENNAHHQMGWIVTWAAAAWVVMGIINIYGDYVKAQRHSGEQVSHANLARYARLHQEPGIQDIRWSNDSGQGTERNSASLFGSSASPSTEAENRNFDESLQEYNNIDLSDDSGEAEKHGFLRHTCVERFLSKNIHHIAFGETLTINRILYTTVERTIIIMGWAVLATGIITFSGIFVCYLIGSFPYRPLLTRDVAWKIRLQWSSPLDQRRYLLLVRPLHIGTLDGRFRRFRMGLEC
jgi:hypothetical protein